MNQIWVILCLAALAYGVMSGQIETMNQVLIEVGQDTFDFVVPVIMMTCFFSGIMEVAKATSFFVLFAEIHYLWRCNS